MSNGNTLEYTEKSCEELGKEHNFIPYCLRPISGPGAKEYVVTEVKCSRCGEQFYLEEPYEWEPPEDE